MSTLTYYNKSIRKITSSFASLFNNIILIRYNEDGTENQRIIVPITFADQEKYTKRIQGDPELDKKIQITLPRMAYELSGIKYDANRKLNTMNKNITCQEEKLFYSFNPVPYDFDFKLLLYTRNIEDGNQILEQIIPYFTPDYTIRINMIPEMNIIRNIPIILHSISPSIQAEGFYNSEVRSVYWQLGFTAKAFIFGAVKEALPIKWTNVNIYEKDLSTINLIGDSINFIPDEIIYQGHPEYPYFTAKVSEWDVINKKLTIIDKMGTLKINQPIMGKKSNSMFTVKDYTNGLLVSKIVSKVEPAYANFEDNWTANTYIERY